MATHKNFAVAYDNLADTATLSGGGWGGTLDKLKNYKLGDYAESANVTALNTRLYIDLAAPAYLCLVGLMGVNASVDAQLQLLVYTDNTRSTVQYDSGVVDHYPMGTVPYGSVPYVCEPQQLEEASRAVLGEAESRIRRDLGSTAPRMEQVTVAGPATELLVEASSGAQLLVVGARGLGGFARLVLGSTSSGCIHRAEVPVVVVGGNHEPAMGTSPVVVGVDDS